MKLQQFPNDFIFTGRGSTALYVILKSLNFSVRNILVPVNVCEIVIPVIEFAGYAPVFYDVNEVHGNAGIEHIRDKYSGNESVLLGVHNFGAPLEIDHIADWARDNNVFLIEDVCNSLGATYKDVPIGGWGDAAIYSFGYSKIIDIGVGGGLTINDPAIRNEAASLISSMEYYSEIHKHKEHSFNTQLRELRKDFRMYSPEFYVTLYREYVKFLLYKIDEPTISLIKIAMQDLGKVIELRSNNAGTYRKEIVSNKIEHISEISGQIYWRYNILTAPHLRDDLIQMLKSENIWVSTWYPPVDRLFTNSDRSDSYPGAYSFWSRVINLFVNDSVSGAGIKSIIELINQYQ